MLVERILIILDESFQSWSSMGRHEPASALVQIDSQNFVDHLVLPDVALADGGGEHGLEHRARRDVISRERRGQRLSKEVVDVGGIGVGHRARGGDELLGVL